MTRLGHQPRAQIAALRNTDTVQRRALLSGWGGFFVDMVDIYLPVIALAPAIAYFQPDSLTASQSGTLFFVTFAATLLGRPLGAAVFGHLADTVGRRRVTLWSIGGFSGCTFAIGMLPGHAAWGLTAPAALITLRFIDGMFLGGEYTAATPLAFEHCPPAGRGLFGGLLMGAYAAAYAAVSALVLFLLLVLPSGAYASWGWRLPFLCGGLLGFALLAYRSRIPESPLWQGTDRNPRPLRTVLTGPDRAGFRQVFLLMVGLWLVATSVVSVLPQLLLTRLEMSATWVTGVLLLAQPVVVGGFVTAGLLGQRWGRRRALVVGATVSGSAGLVLYAATMSLPLPPSLLAAGVVLTEAVVLGVWGVVISYCNERFATAVRASGFGLAYSLAVVPASFYAFYLAGLAHVMPQELTQLVLLAVGSVLSVVGALQGPETRQVDLAAPAASATRTRGERRTARPLVP